MTPIEQKAILFVLEGRCRLDHADDTLIYGQVKGDHGVYRVSVDPDGHHCDCDYGRFQGGRHSHTVALQLVAEAVGQGIPVPQLEEVAYG